MTDSTTEVVFPLTITWTNQGSTASGTITSTENGLWLSSDHNWTIISSPDSRVVPPTEVRGMSSDGPVYMRGNIELQQGRNRLRLGDLRIGTDDPEEPIVSVRAVFEHAREVGGYYHRDGPARSQRLPLKVPPTGDAPSMTLLFESGGVEFTSRNHTRLEHFETHLDALQRLFTFASQRSTARLSLQAETKNGTTVRIFGRTAVKPSSASPPDFRDFPVRLGGANAQQVIHDWWALMENLRPIPQVLSSILAHPGYVETDFLLYATAVDRLSEAWTEEPGLLTAEQFTGLKQAAITLGLPKTYFLGNEPSFGSRASALATLLPESIWTAVKIDQETWLQSLKRHRNLVAHSTEQKASHRRFLTGPGLRALRDATAAILTLVIAQYLGVSADALTFAAARQNHTRVTKHTFRTLGFSNDGVRALPDN